MQGGLNWPRRKWCRITVCVDNELSSPCGFSSINKPFGDLGDGGERHSETNLTPNERRSLRKSLSTEHTTTKALLYVHSISKRNKQNSLNQNLAMAHLKHKFSFKGLLVMDFMRRKAVIIILDALTKLRKVTVSFVLSAPAWNNDIWGFS